MWVERLWLQDFRCYEHLDVELPPGVTVITGANGEGKTSLLEAVSWATGIGSFRGVPDAALVRAGSEQAVLRMQARSDEREQLLEAELRPVGRNRVLVNRKPLRRNADLLGFLRVTVFAPDDLDLVKGSPAGRRRCLDDLLVTVSPRLGVERTDFERVLRQRNMLLRNGVHSAEARDTLAVFDEQLVCAGAEIVRSRLGLIEQLQPAVDRAYRDLAGGEAPIVDGRYEAEWASPGELDAEDVETELRAALVARRRQELDRGLTLVGPHRDDWHLTLAGLESRTHASQGEQRTLALGLRLATHRVCSEAIGDSPVLLLDDVFSELDEDRRVRLVQHVPTGQTIVTTAGVVPGGITPDRTLRVHAGRLEAA